MNYDAILAAGKEVLLRQAATGQFWRIAYAAINLDGADVRIRESDQAGLSRHEVAVGDTVGFTDAAQHQRQGQVVRLNDKTVRLLSDGQKWRVSYSYLHRILEGRVG